MRRFTGAYKTTPITVLEEMTNCPPIDLVLDRQVSRFALCATEITTGRWTSA